MEERHYTPDPQTELKTAISPKLETHSSSLFRLKIYSNKIKKECNDKNIIWNEQYGLREDQTR